jgi:predicted ATP-grasp superfamily ATP-dependent carboligase
MSRMLEASPIAASVERVAVPRGDALGSRVLVTDGDERSALAVVRSLGRAAHDVYVCSRRGRSIAGASRYARADSSTKDPLHDPDGFAREVAAIAHRVGADIVIPVSEASLLAVLGNSHLFDGTIVPFADESDFRRVCDKRAVLAAASELGIATPMQHTLREPDELPTLVASGELQFPVVLKPSRSVVSDPTRRSKVGVSYAADAQELHARAASYPRAAYPLLLQQRIVGPGIGVFVLRWNDRTVAAFSHRRLREKPPSGGVSVYAESIPLDPALLAHVEALLAHFAWRGVAMVEFKVDRATGTPYLMEINGRFWGSLQLAIAAGVDFPLLLCTVAQGKRVARQPAYEVGVRNRWWWGDVDHLIARIRRSNARLQLPPDSPSRTRAILDFFRWRRGDQNEVFKLNDAGPFLRETAHWLKRS